jgi:hypothetical protein
VASGGQNVNQTVVVAESQEVVAQALVAATAGVPDYNLTTAGPGSIVLSRRYLPTWAIVVAVVGFLLFLLGLLALLYRVTETITITIVPTEGGSRVSVSGVGSPELLSRLTAVIGSMPSSDPAIESRHATETTLHQGNDLADDKVCPACAETIKQAAKVCRYCSHRFDQEAGPFSTMD